MSDVIVASPDDDSDPKNALRRAAEQEVERIRAKGVIGAGITGSVASAVQGIHDRVSDTHDKTLDAQKDIAAKSHEIGMSSDDPEVKKSALGALGRVSDNIGRGAREAYGFSKQALIVVGTIAAGALALSLRARD